MNKKLFLLVFLVSSLIIPIISALCDSGQIDINTASLNELDNLYGIGPAKAEGILDYRANQKFNSVDDLIKVKGIGEITLNKIKEQGLACVNVETEEINEKEIIEKNDKEDNNEEVEEKEQSNQNTNNEIIEESKENTEHIKLNTIKLNPKDIKTEKNSKEEYLEKDNYVIYALLPFCILLGLLFSIKAIKRKQKNEFQ